MLLTRCLYPLVFHLFLPTEGIVAQKGITIAYQQRTDRELARIACSVLAEELTPDSLRADVSFAAEGQYLLTELDLGRCGEDVEIAEVNVVAVGVADIT